MVSSSLALAPYSPVLPDMQEAAAEKLAAMFRGARRNASTEHNPKDCPVAQGIAYGERSSGRVL
jgi:hypothetical protein